MSEMVSNNIFRNPRGYILWTEEQIEYICSSYLSGEETGHSLAKFFNVNKVCIYRVLEQHNISRQSALRNKKVKNSKYFSNIDSVDKAYWLGVFYADGNVQDNYTIKLKMIDKEHIEKFCRAIDLDTKYIYTYTSVSKNHYTPYEIRFKDKQMYQDLCKLECMPRKSLQITKMPDIDKELYSHFIRGYSDGDGTISRSPHGKYKKDWVFQIVGQYGLLEDFQRIFKKHNKISATNPDNTCYRIAYKGNKQLAQLLGFIYHNSTEETRLDREYNLYLDFLKELDGKYPLGLST